MVKEDNMEQRNGKEKWNKSIQKRKEKGIKSKRKGKLSKIREEEIKRFERKREII